MSDAEKIKFVEEQRRHHGGPDAERDGERRGPRRPARDSDSE